MFRIVVTLDGLDEEALIRILKEPKNSLTKQYHKLFELDGVELEFEEDALKEVARKSLERKTGARGLRSIMEKSLMDLMYRTPSDNTICKCIITKDAVDGTGEPEVVHGEQPAMQQNTTKKKFPFQKDRKAGDGLKKGLKIDETANQHSSGDRSARHNDPSGNDRSL